MEEIIIGVPDPHGPYGFKGVGEIGVVHTAPALLMFFTSMTEPGITNYQSRKE